MFWVIYMRYLMRSIRCLALITALPAAAAGLSAPVAQQAKSNWVYPGPDGKLVYKTLPAGDKIMDFSHAGYMGGGVALPTVAVKMTVEPSGGDDTAKIQAAIDAVAGMPLKDGFRGAVLLAPGVYTCSDPIKIAASGVVLRGSASMGETRSTIKLVDKPHTGITVAGKADGMEPFKAASTKIADAYVPSGATSFTVADAKGFAAGDMIAIRKSVTAEWVKFMGMDDLVRDGKKQTWLAVGRVLSTTRQINAVDGNKITLNAPVSDSFDAKFAGPQGTEVVKTRPTWLTQIGIEHLHIESPPQAIEHTKPHFKAMDITGQDCWVRDVICDETMTSISVHGRRITLQGVFVNRKAKAQGASRPGEIEPCATQTLVDRCGVTADNVWFVWTGQHHFRPDGAAQLQVPGRQPRRVAPSLVHRHALRQLPGAGRQLRVPQSRRNGLRPRLVDGLGRGLELCRQGIYHPEPAWLRELADRLHRQEQAQPSPLRQRPAEFAGRHP